MGQGRRSGRMAVPPPTSPRHGKCGWQPEDGGQSQSWSPRPVPTGLCGRSEKEAGGQVGPKRIAGSDGAEALRIEEV